MPSKLLIAAAEAAHAHRARDTGFGVHVDGAPARRRPRGHGTREARARPLRRLRAGGRGRDLRGGSHPRLRALRRPQHARGRRRTRIDARAIVIATGSRPAVPAMLQGARRPARRERRRLLVGRPAALRRRVRPRRDRPGAGPGALAPRRSRGRARAAAAAWAPSPIRRSARAAIQAFGERNSSSIPMRTSRAWSASATRCEIDYVGIGRREASRERFDYVLAATGRAPNVDGLGPRGARASSSVATACRSSIRARLQARRQQHLHRGRRRRTSCRCCTRRPTRARIAGDNAARYPGVAPAMRRAPLGIVFTDPQIAIVGGGYASLHRARHRGGRSLLRRPGALARDASQPGACCASTRDPVDGTLPRRRDGRAPTPSTSGTCSRGRCSAA